MALLYDFMYQVLPTMVKKYGREGQYLRPEVKYDCHGADIQKTYAT